jgi:hypothetical protein
MPTDDASKEHGGPSGPIVEGRVSITDLFGLGAATKNLTPAVIEIIKAAGAGAGKVYEPASIYLNERAKGAAERHNALADAKAYLDLKTRSPAVLEAMKERVLGTEYRRQENIMAAQQEAIGIAFDNTSETVAEVHPDFMAEWVEGVKDVSDEMVRKYWSHLLAAAPMTKNGRVEKPVVDFLKSLDHRLCQDLETYYAASYCTNGVLFEGLNFQDSMAQEVGLGIYRQRLNIETNDRTLRIAAQTGHLQVFQMGERATKLCEIAFPEVDEEQSLAQFYGSLPERVHFVALSQSTTRLTFEIIDSRNSRHYFDLDFAGAQMVGAKRPNVGLLADLNLSTRASGENLRAALLPLGEYLHYRGAEQVKSVAL